MILVTGATGTVGRRLVKRLASAGHRVRALVRPGHGRDLRARKLDLFDGDLDDPASLREAVRRVERVYLLAPSGPNMVAEELALIDAAEREGVEQIVMHSSVGAGELDGRFFRQHGETEHALRQGRVPWTILRPNAFMTNLEDFAPAIRRDGRFFAAFGQGRVAMIDPDDIAASAMAVLTTPGHLGETYELSGPEPLSYSTIAERIGRVAGRVVEYIDVPPEAALDGLRRAGVADWEADGLIELMRLIREGHFDVVSEDVLRLIGRPPRSLDDFLRDHASLFAPLPEAERPTAAP